MTKKQMKDELKNKIESEFQKTIETFMIENNLTKFPILIYEIISDGYECDGDLSFRSGDELSQYYNEDLDLSYLSESDKEIILGDAGAEVKFPVIDYDEDEILYIYGVPERYNPIHIIATFKDNVFSIN